MAVTRKSKKTEIQWATHSDIHELVTKWKEANYSLDSVLLTLRKRDYIVGGKRIYGQNVIDAWNAKEVDLDL